MEKWEQIAKIIKTWCGWDLGWRKNQWIQQIMAPGVWRFKKAMSTPPWCEWLGIWGSKLDPSPQYGEVGKNWKVRQRMAWFGILEYKKLTTSWSMEWEKTRRAAAAWCWETWNSKRRYQSAMEIWESTYPLSLRMWEFGKSGIQTQKSKVRWRFRRIKVSPDRHHGEVGNCVNIIGQRDYGVGLKKVSMDNLMGNWGYKVRGVLPMGLGIKGVLIEFHGVGWDLGVKNRLRSSLMVWE